MSSKNPETIMVSSKGSNGISLGHIPNSNRFVFTVGQDQFLARVENSTGHIVEMSTACVDFPSLGI